ncbi:sensor histidine kinase [Neobacillus vireti]|uniref:sensor histidine kinase n=1 Tax=Neobacillus vireti TaxID=220686 RepID=UPI002FFE7C4A
MSIRKSLFISNAAMIMIPIIVFFLYFLLLNIVIGGGMKNWTQNFQHRWQTQPSGTNNQLFTDLKKTASLESEKFLNPSFTDSITKKLTGKNVGVIIRKDEKVLYISNRVKDLKNEKLPSFGNEGYMAATWIGDHPYALWQHDFYFQDGKKGSILLLDEGVPFIQFAKKFFPMIFIGLVIIVVFTNALLSLFMSRRILKPIEQLADAASNISQGQLDFKLASSSKNELGKLVNHFDEMRQKLKNAAELREQYERNRKELIANISHDLKTPITTIRGYVEGIKDGVANTEEKLKRYLNTIHIKAAQLDRLIDELFLFSKLDMNGIPFYFENVDIIAYLKDYVEELRLEMRQENVQLFLEIKGDSRTNVLLDRDKMIRVMNNIIYNSVKYGDKDQCKICISVEEQGDLIEVSSGDNGPGVPSGDLSSIFNHFYRGDPSRNSTTGGSGIGLAIAAQIIKAHGGMIWAESPPGQGLIIKFTLSKQGETGDHA